MSRYVSLRLLAALALLVSNVATASAAGRPGLPTIALVSPGVVEPGVSTAVTLQLPASVAALEGRLLVNDDALEFIGVAPRGAGSVLRPTSVGAGSYAFAAYGLSSAKGHTTLDLVVFPKVAGQLQLRLVIDAAADAAGHRLALANRAQQASLGVGRAATVVAAPQAAPAQAPTRAALPARDIVGNGRIDRQDLDSVRGDWYANHAQGVSCGALAGDANADGCVDVVDLQAELAAQGTRSATPAVTSLVAAQPQAIGDPIAHTFVVTSTADTPDAAPGNGLCADSTGQCTLRAAITEADWLAGNDLIQFALAGTAPVTIQLASRLPNITSLNGTLTIDGYSQPGSAVNTASAGSNAIMGVEIRGNGQAAREMAFYVSSPGNVIRGLLIDNVYRGIFLDGSNAHDNRIVGNWIGFRKDTTSPGSNDVGVALNYGANHNLIGTPTLADRNVIANARVAEDVYGTGTDYNVTQNNVLCMRPNGTSTANCQIGIDHNFGPKHHLIGGTGVNERNVIGGTALQGIEFSHGWNPSNGQYVLAYQISNNQAIGNWVGFRGDGSYNASFRSGLNASSADNANGINIYDGSYDNLVEANYVASVYDGIQVGLYTHAEGNIVRNNFIGLSPLGEEAPMSGWGVISRGSVSHNMIVGNTIRNAGRGGIGLTNVNNNGSASNVAYNTLISQNLVFNTNGPAIDLYGPAGGGGAGPDPNDPGDADSGANTQLNTPAFTSATTAAVSGTAYAGATVELYRASRPAGQYGLPIAYLGSATVAGNGTWTIPVALQAGDRVTALQILPDSNTSELAANVAATAAAPNQPPVFSTEFTDRSDAEGAVISFDADATDPDGDTLNYSATNLPAGISINPSTGVVSGTLAYTAAGVYNVVLTASDGSLTDTDSFTWTVTNTNRAPVFSTEFIDRTDAEGAVINLDANASDPDGDTLVYSATNLPDGITINSSTGVVSGTLNSTSSGVYAVTLTVSDGSLTDIDTFTWTVNEPGTLAQDLFSRTVANGWGSAPTGGTYTLSGGAGSFNVTGSAGTMTFGSAGTFRSAALAGVSALNVDLSFRVATNKLAAGGAQFVYGVARRVSSTAEYRAKLRLAPNGSVYIQAGSVFNNTETPLGSEVQVPGLTYTPGSFIWLRMQVSGTNPTTIRIRAWADGSAEPATWQYSATSSTAALQSAGGVGLSGYISGATSNAPVVFTFDDFQATILGGP